MKRSSTPTFALTIPLIATPSNDRVLFGCMEAGRRLYNAVLGEALRRLGLLKQSKAWRAAHDIKDKKQRASEYQQLTKAANFTLASLVTFARKCKNSAGWKNRLGSNVTQRIAEQAFAATEQYAYGKRGKPRFKGLTRPLHSLSATDNTANIIWKQSTGCIQFGSMILRALLPNKDQDVYVNQALACRTKYCRVLWRNINGQRRWFAQLMQEGKPPIKHQYSPENKDVVGLDIGPSTIAVVSQYSASFVRFCDTVVEPSKKLRRMQRAMDRSRRTTNPECFHANGTWISGQKFTPSKCHTKLRMQCAEIARKLADERKRSHGELANQILQLGIVVQSETLSYKSFQKNYGKSVQIRAPGMFVEKLRRKAESAGGQLVDLHTWSLKMSQYDHISNTYTKKPLNEEGRWHHLGDGSGVVHRDIYSAFLARCVIGNKHHLPHIETMWGAQKPVLLQTKWLRSKAAKIKPSGKITVLTPSE